MRALKKLFGNYSLIGVLFVLLALVLTYRNLALPADAFDGVYTHYNNYKIFKQSFYHLISGKDLYVSYPSEHFDLFKYSPTFALLFGLLARMPDWLGLALWNLLNVVVLFYAIKQLPNLSSAYKLGFGLLVLQELITTTMNSQSNALIAGLLILAWVSLEKGYFARAGFFILLTAFIKIFGVLFFILFLFYPKWWRSFLPILLIAFALFLMPVIVVGFHPILKQYQSYAHLLAADNEAFVKYSVMGWLEAWFGISIKKYPVVITGFLLQILPLFIHLYNKMSKNPVQNQSNITALYAASLMIWLVIFNHMAESATFIIAVCGVMLWFFYCGLPKWWRIAFLLPVMLFTCFGPSDIYPPEWRHKIVVEWQLKVFPCILVWSLCIGELVINNIKRGFIQKTSTH